MSTIFFPKNLDKKSFLTGVDFRESRY